MRSSYNLRKEAAYRRAFATNYLSQSSRYYHFLISSFLYIIFTLNIRFNYNYAIEL